MGYLVWRVDVTSNHLAYQEDFYWVQLAQGRRIAPELDELVGYGRPASTPPLNEMWDTWREVTIVADDYLDTVTTEMLQTHFEWQGQAWREASGTLLYRNLYHYWFHAGEAAAVRQMLGHTDLPQFVGDMSTALYQPEIISS